MATGLNGLDTIRPPTSVEAARPVAVIGEARQELYQRALQRLVGQSLDSPVLSKYTDGSFLVKFADTPARVILPPGTEVGDSVPLTLVSVDPRPTFFLGNETNGKLAKSPLIYLDPHASDEVELSGETEPPPETPAPPPRPEQTASRNLARQFLQVESLLSPFERMASERASPQNQAPDPNAPARSAQTSLSSAGQLINSLLQAGQSAPRAIVGQNAIVPAPDTGSQEVAAALHDTLAYSGLFYESHVSEWVDGKRPITELLREPQMQQVPTKAENAQDSNQLALPQLVNLQLTTHEQQSTRWIGEIWPGQNMEWDVEKQPHPQNSPQGDAPAAWQSTVRFELPNLGTISARLNMLGQHLQIQIQTTSEDSANALRQHAGALAEALGAAGSSLDSLLVQPNEQH